MTETKPMYIYQGIVIDEVVFTGLKGLVNLEGNRNRGLDYLESVLKTFMECGVELGVLPTVYDKSFVGKLPKNYDLQVHNTNNYIAELGNKEKNILIIELDDNAKLPKQQLKQIRKIGISMTTLGNLHNNTVFSAYNREGEGVFTKLRKPTLSLELEFDKDTYEYKGCKGYTIIELEDFTAKYNKDTNPVDSTGTNYVLGCGVMLPLDQLKLNILFYTESGVDKFINSYEEINHEELVKIIKEKV